jgi:hypothetical protein
LYKTQLHFTKKNTTKNKNKPGTAVGSDSPIRQKGAGATPRFQKHHCVGESSSTNAKANTVIYSSPIYNSSRLVGDSCSSFGGSFARSSAVAGYERSPKERILIIESKLERTGLPLRPNERGANRAGVFAWDCKTTLIIPLAEQLPHGARTHHLEEDLFAAAEYPACDVRRKSCLDADLEPSGKNKDQGKKVDKPHGGNFP